MSLGTAKISEIIFLRLIGLWSDWTEVYHVVMFDADKKVVWECAENYDIKNFSCVFGLCFGEDASLVPICEVKYLEKKPERDERKRYKNTHHMSYYKIK